jgi:hypothetical protein
MIENTIETHFEELDKIKRKFELVEWLYAQGLSYGDTPAMMWEYRAKLKDMAKEIVEGGDI